MIAFCAFGILGLAMLAGHLLFDLGISRGYKKGVEVGRRTAEHEAFMRGVLWYSSSDDAIEIERRNLWRKEISAHE